MAKCRCTNVAHSNHPNNECDKPATANDGYCQECHNRAANESYDWIERVAQ